MNLGPPEYEAGVLTIWPQHSVVFHHTILKPKNGGRKFLLNAGTHPEDFMG
jgi:hypothetical protein